MNISHTEWTRFQEDILDNIKKFQYNIALDNNNQKERIQEKLILFNEKCEDLSNRFQALSKNIINSNFLSEKIEQLSKSKTKIEEIILSHNNQINKISTDFTNATYKYDKVIEDNFTIPNLIGINCKYKNLRAFFEFLNINIGEILHHSDLQTKEYQRYKERLEDSMKQYQCQISATQNSFADLIREFKVETESKFYDKIKVIENLISTVRFENSNYAFDLKKLIEQMKIDKDLLAKLKQSINEELREEVNKVNEEHQKDIQAIIGFKSEFKEIKKRFGELKDMIINLKMKKDINNNGNKKQFILSDEENNSDIFLNEMGKSIPDNPNRDLRKSKKRGSMFVNPIKTFKSFNAQLLSHTESKISFNKSPNHKEIINDFNSDLDFMNIKRSIYENNKFRTNEINSNNIKDDSKCPIKKINNNISISNKDNNNIIKNNESHINNIDIFNINNNICKNNDDVDLTSNNNTKIFSHKNICDNLDINIRLQDTLNNKIENSSIASDNNINNKNTLNNNCDPYISRNNNIYDSNRDNITSNIINYENYTKSKNENVISLTISNDNDKKKKLNTPLTNDIIKENIQNSISNNNIKTMEDNFENNNNIVLIENENTLSNNQTIKQQINDKESVKEIKIGANVEFTNFTNEHNENNPYENINSEIKSDNKEQNFQKINYCENTIGKSEKDLFFNRTVKDNFIFTSKKGTQTKYTEIFRTEGNKTFYNSKNILIEDLKKHSYIKQKELKLNVNNNTQIHIIDNNKHKSTENLSSKENKMIKTCYSSNLKKSEENKLFTDTRLPSLLENNNPMINYILEKLNKCEFNFKILKSITEQKINLLNNDFETLQNQFKNNYLKTEIDKNNYNLPFKISDIQNIDSNHKKIFSYHNQSKLLLYGKSSFLNKNLNKQNNIIINKKNRSMSKKGIKFKSFDTNIYNLKNNFSNGSVFMSTNQKLKTNTNNNNIKNYEKSVI